MLFILALYVEFNIRGKFKGTTNLIFNEKY